MQHIFRVNILKNLSGYFIIALFIWISFFPPPLQLKYHLFTNLFLISIFLLFFARKRFSLFKLNDYPLWFFLITISINIFFAQQRNVALNTYLNLAIPMFCIYYLIPEGLSSEKSFNLLIKTICICSILVSLGGILESLFAYNPLYAHLMENSYYTRYISGFVRPMSTQFNPAPLGGYLLGCLPFNYLLFKRNISFFSLLGAVGIVLNTVVLILIFSRAAFLGLMAITAYYLFVQKNYRSIIVLFIISFIFVLLCYKVPYPFSKFSLNNIIKKDILSIYKPDKSDKRLRNIKDHNMTGLRYQGYAKFGDGVLSDYRLERFNMVLRIIKDYPFAGLGFQHFRIKFNEYYSGKQETVPYEKMIADNMYLTILAETGIIGFLGFLIFVFSFLKKGWRQLKILNSNSQERWRLLIGLMAFIGLLVNMVGYEFFYWHNQYMLFCIICGFVQGVLGNA